MIKVYLIVAVTTVATREEVCARSRRRTGSSRGWRWSRMGEISWTGVGEYTVASFLQIAFDQQQIPHNGNPVVNDRSGHHKIGICSRGVCVQYQYKSITLC
jgi:hypothetical protein